MLGVCIYVSFIWFILVSGCGSIGDIGGKLGIDRELEIGVRGGVFAVSVLWSFGERE